MKTETLSSQLNEHYNFRKISITDPVPENVDVILVSAASDSVDPLVLENLEKFVPDKMVDDLCIAGTPDIAIKKLNTFHSIGIDMPIIQFNPIGNVKESFQLLTDTFSGELNE